MFDGLKEVFQVKPAGVPYINVPSANIYRGISYGMVTDKRLMMDYAKRNPVVMGIVKAIATDIVTRVRFRALKQSSKGRPTSDAHEKKELAASEFAKKQMFKTHLLGAMYDWLITGEGFLWHGSVPKSKLKEVLAKLSINNSDVDTNGVHAIRSVASTTMTPKYDRHGVIAYEQIVSVAEINLWTNDNIIHAKFIDLDGKPQGFTPMLSARPMIETLGLIIDYAGNWFDSGGTPENIFSFPKEVANSENFNKAKAEVKARFENNKQRGQLFFAGELKVDKINDWNKDMEFRKLFILYVGSIAFAFNMPLHRIQSILGADMSAGAASSDLSDSGYWRSIYEAQDYWEQLLNVGFWNEAFGVDMEFERTYLQDTFRETQATNMALSNIEMLEKLDLIKKEFKKEVYSTLAPSIPSEAINDDPQPKSVSTGLNRQNMLPNQEMERGSATKRMSDEKAKSSGKTSAEETGL